MSFEPKPSKKKTTMSVPEMGRLLGLKKTDWYYVLYNSNMKTIMVGGKIRIYIDSFEEWYANQWHYKKVTGEHPGWKLAAYITIEEIEADLGIKSADWLIYASKKFKLHKVSGMTCIKRCEYEQWYTKQFRYKKVSGEEPGTFYPPSYSAREVADMLGIALRNTLYSLTAKGVFRSFVADNQLRIDKASFEEWYKNQNHYKKVSESEE